MKKTVYHGSSNKNLRFNPNKPLMFFTTSKEDAHDWADRVVLGNKRNTGSYVYTAELTYNKPYKVGDSDFNPEYEEYKDSPDKDTIYTEIFFEDIHTKREELVKAGYDCFIDNQFDGFEYYIIPYECRKNIRWIDKETLSENAEVLENPELITDEKKSEENFWKWFDGSKCIDKDGTPKIVYHGSPNIFTSFNKTKLGSSTAKYEKDNIKSAAYGFFFIDNKDYADRYTMGKGKVYSCYLSIKNPLEVDMDDYIATDEVITNFIKQAIEEKRDGVIFKNIREINTPPSTEYVVFNPNQIKSIDNNGQWSNSSNIYESLNEELRKYL